MSEMVEAYLTSDKRSVVVTYDEGLARAIPHARSIVWRGAQMLVLPNLADEARVARNMGVNIPSPILTTYDWRKTTPWEIQRTTAALLSESPRCYVLSELGTGKTRGVLYAMDWLLQTRQIRRALVITPLSTLTPVWEREIFTLMLPYKVSVLYGTRERRLRMLDADTPIAIVNHHGVAVLGDAGVDAGFDLIVIDELATYRNRRTELWKAANRLVERSSFAWGLTGAPTPNAPTDAWAQVKLLTPARTTRTFTAFQEQTMVRVNTFKWAPKPGANELVAEAMKPGVRFTRADVMELPDCTTVDRDAPLEGDALKAYQMLYKKARMLCANGESITAANEDKCTLKLIRSKHFV